MYKIRRHLLIKYNVERACNACDISFVTSQVHVVLLNDVILITERGGDGSLTALERPILLKDVSHCTGANSKHRKCYTTSHVSSQLYRHVADLYSHCWCSMPFTFYK